MKTSQRGLDDIIISEGEKLVAYRDRLTGKGGQYFDVWTIGVGHTSAAGPPEVTEGMRITHEQSRDILSLDIAAVEVRVAKVFSKAVPQNVFDGAVSFDFNTGGILRASWVARWLNNDMGAAEAAFLNWNKPPEIIGRRKREADLIFRGKYRSPASASPVSGSAVLEAVQRQLADLGYPPGPIDGLDGPKTQIALANFRSNNADLLVLLKGG